MNRLMFIAAKMSPYFKATIVSLVMVAANQ